MNSSAQQAIDPKLPTGPPLKTALKIVSRSTETRASNAARAALVVANVTPTGYRVGLFMAGHARYAKPEDIRRNVVPGEIFCYWSQAKIAAKLGCSESTVSRGVRSLREAGVMDVRQRVRPCEASYVWVVSDQSPDQSSDQSNDRPYDVSGAPSGDGSGDWSHTEPRNEPQKNHEGSSRAREDVPLEPEQDPTRWYCPCTNDWPKSYGPKCHDCGTVAGSAPAAKPTTDRPACTCATSYRNAYRGKCLDCEGKPSAAQIDAVREKAVCMGEVDRVGVDGGVVRAAGPGIDAPPLEAIASTPPRAETETRQPPETRGESSEDSVLPEHAIPPDGGEPGANEQQFYQDMAKWRLKKGATHDGQTDDRTAASIDDGSEAQRRRDDRDDQGRGERVEGHDTGGLRTGQRAPPTPGPARGHRPCEHLHG